MIPQQMPSPITGKMMPLIWEDRVMEFRKEKFHVLFPFYKCPDSGEQFTTTDTDGVWYRQIANQYCCKYGIPYMDEIVAIRERYGLSAAAMSKILGFGTNQWRLYEQEEVPSVSNGRMIRSIMNPKVMMDMVQSAQGCLNQKEFERFQKRVSHILSSSDSYHIQQYELQRIYAYARGKENGYGMLSLARLKNTILFILERCQEVWCTKMSKLLFYADFLAYRERATAITGLAYRAIEFGPVPERWERVFSQFDEIRQEPRAIGSYEGSVLVADAKADMSQFSQDEVAILDHVCKRLGQYSSCEVSELSHQEQGWIHSQEQHSIIPYEYAFKLQL